MKQVNLTLLFVAIFAVGTFAQDSPSKSFKNATKKLRTYILNTDKNVDALKEAKDLIDAAIQGIDEIKTKDQPKVYNKAGEVYFEIAKQANLKAKNPEAGAKSMEYLLKAAEHAEAKSFTKDKTLEWLNQLSRSIFLSDGTTAVNSGEYEFALSAFENFIKCDEKISELNPLLSLGKMEPAQYENIKYYAGFAAYHAGKKEVAKKYLEPLAKESFDEAYLYSYLSKIYKEEGDNDKSIEMIDKGVTVLSGVKIPEDATDEVKTSEKKRISTGLKALLYDKINFYLSTKQLDKLEGSLKKAMAEEPDNPQLPFTLGQVYEGLSADAYTAENNEEGDRHLASAISYYKQTVEIKEDYYDAIYQQGAIFFNSAVRVYKVQANLGISADDRKKSEELGTQINDYYSKAWKAFMQAEKVRANDQLLIVAFKQLYLRVNNNDAYGEYKKREEAVKADPKVELKPYEGHPADLFKK